jgi:DNA-binding SARP family transcriptional activator
VRLTGHPRAAVRRAAVQLAARSGRPELPGRLGELAADPDEGVRAAATAAARRLRAAPPPLSFELLGGFAVRRGAWAADDAAWGRRVAQRLVRLLLVRAPDAVAEDDLLEAFWPDKPAGAARHSLQTAISSARRILDVPGAESVLEAGQRSYRLRLRAGDTVDAERFERAAAAALDERGARRRELLAGADAEWGGEPLPEERFADWAVAWRERLVDRHVAVLAALAEEGLRAGDLPGATEVALRLVEADPLGEAGHRTLMVAYARAGRRGHSLRQYLACRRALVDELGVEPAVQTSDLQRRILAGEAL